MGTIRVLLALSVVLAHSGWGLLVGTTLAVQMFYMISGFLITYVLTNTPAYSNPLAFYSSRFLRLFPAYWIVAAITLAGYLVLFAIGKDAKVERFLDLPTHAQALLALVNVTLFGQDVIMFLGLRSGQVVFTGDYNLSTPPLWIFLLVPPAWTLGVELAFYLLAPFIVRRTAVLLALLVLSLLARAVAIAYGFGLQDPWLYRFFPFELAIFIVGALSCKFILPIVKHRFSTTPGARQSVFAALVLLVCVFAWIPGPYYAKHVVLLVGLALALPFLFTFQNANSWDRQLGELSYPIYISHFLMMYISSVVDTSQGPRKAIIVATASIVFSLVLNKVLNVYVETSRARIRGGSSQRA